MARVTTFHFSGSDPESLSEFYGTIFGWKFKRTPATNPTWFVSTGLPDESGIDGMLHTRERDNAVVNTIEVSNINLVIKSVETAGGTILDRRTIPGAGQIALFADPEQNVFQLREPPEKSE